MKILVTGGAGFIGSNLIEKLLKEGHKVVCLDNFNDYYDPLIKRNNIKGFLSKSRFKLIEADIRDRVGLDKIFDKFRFQKVVHLAAQPGVRFSLENPYIYFDVNVNGTLNVLDLCKKYSVKGLIFGSSSSVYGITKSIPFSEDGETKPISPYGVSKKAGELLCFNYNYLYGIPITILRFFTVYGPRQRPDMAIYKFTRLVDNDKKINIFGNGKTKRDYTFISDIVDGIISALKKDFDFEIFNLGNSKPVILSYLISLLEKNLKKKAKVRFSPEQPGDPPITYADIKKSKKLLGYKPKTSIEEGIKKYVNWYKNEKA